MLVCRPALTLMVVRHIRSVAYEQKYYRLHRKDYIEPPHRDFFVWKDEPPATVAMLDWANWDEPLVRNHLSLRYPGG
jgi:hypothetical protein